MSTHHIIIIAAIIVAAIISCPVWAEDTSANKQTDVSDLKPAATPVPTNSSGSPGAGESNLNQSNPVAGSDRETVTGGQTGMQPGSSGIPSTHTSSPSEQDTSGSRQGNQESPQTPDPSRQEPVPPAITSTPASQVTPVPTPGNQPGQKTPDSARQDPVSPAITPVPTNPGLAAGMNPVSGGSPYPADRSLPQNLHYGPDTGAILVSSSPAGASVYIDDNYKGKTSSSEYLDISDLSPGTYTVLLSSSGYEDYSTDITISRNEVETLHAVLISEPVAATVSPVGIISIQSNPSGAGVYLDNEYRGITPLTLREVSIGDHSILVREDGYSEYSGTVRIESDQTTVISATLTEQPRVQEPVVSPTETLPQAPVAMPAESALPVWIPGAGLIIGALCFTRRTG